MHQTALFSDVIIIQDGARRLENLKNKNVVQLFQRQALSLKKIE